LICDHGESQCLDGALDPGLRRFRFEMKLAPKFELKQFETDTSASCSVDLLHEISQATVL